MARVLIVDDDTYLRDLYEEVLKGEGYDVTTAVDGEDGLAKLQEGGFDLILLDVMMPKIDGLGVLKALREKPARQENKNIILLTNLAQDPIIQDGLGLGATSYLIKADITPDTLAQEVKKYITA